MIAGGRHHLPRSLAPGLAIVGIMPAMLGVVLALGNPWVGELVGEEPVLPGGATRSISSAALLAQAQALQQAGDLVAARDMVLTALQRDPANAQAHALLVSLDSQKSGQPTPRDGDPSGGDIRLQAALAEARMQVARAELLAAGSRFEDAIVLLAQSHNALTAHNEHPAVQAESQRIEALLTTYRESLTVNHGRDARQSREAGRQAAEARTQHSQRGEVKLLSERTARGSLAAIPRAAPRWSDCAAYATW